MINCTKCCRLCLKDSDFLQKFNSKDIAELCSKIHQHFDVLISEVDELSTKVCQECASKVYDFAVFYNCVQLNQQQLKLCMEIQNKIPKLKQEDDDCVFINVETDHITFVPNSENTMITVNSNDTINSIQKRSSNTPTISKNYDTKRSISPLYTMNNIQLTSNIISAATPDTIVEKEALIINEVVKPNNILTPTNQITENNFEIINIKSINNSQIPCFSKDMTNSITNDKETSINDLQISSPPKKIKKNFHQKLINKSRLLKLSDSNKNLLKRYKCKNSYVKLKRFSTLENNLNQINLLIESNIKRITVEKIKGKVSNELIENNTALKNMNKEFSEKLNHSKNIQILKNSKTLKHSLTINDGTINKKSMKLNTRTSAILTNNNKNKSIKTIRTSNRIKSNCRQILENNMKFTNLQNKIEIPVIIPPMSIQKENLKNDTVHSVNKLHIMNSSQLTEQNIQISTYSTTSTRPAEPPQKKIIEPKISIVKKPLNNIVKRPIINSISQLPQNVLTPATINKTPINNTRKAHAELCTRHLFPAKLPKGQSLTEEFYLQNQIQISNIGKSQRQNLLTISTSPVVVVASTLQAVAPLMTTIQQQHLNRSASKKTLQKPHTENNQQQLQRNNFQHAFKQTLELHEQTTQQNKSKMGYCKNKSIINKQPVQKQLNLQINTNDEVQIQEYNNQQQMQQNSQPEKQSPYVFNKIQNNSAGRVKILTVPELNQKAYNNQLLYNKLPVSSTSVTPMTSFSQISSYSSIQPISQYQQISKNNLSSTTIDAILPIDHAKKSRKQHVCVNISKNKNQITIKLNNLETGKLCHYWELSEQQKESVKQSLYSIDKKNVKRFKPYQLDDYAKNLLERINFIEFRNNFAL